MENITLKIKIGNIDEPAPFIFDDSLDLGRVTTQVLILKDYLSNNLDSALYVGQNNCTTPIDWREGPYFDKKTRYALYVYQKQQSVKSNIISFLLKNTLEPNSAEATAAAEEIYQKELGTMSLATIAVMHGYSIGQDDGPEIEPVFLNKTYTTDDEVIEDESRATESELYKSTERILNLINDAALGEYGSFDQSALEVTELSSQESNPRSSIEYFQRPDPNIIGIDDIKAGNSDEYFELDGNKIGLYIPSAEDPEDSYTLANPPKLEDAGWNVHVAEASKRALKEIMLQLYDLDITQSGTFEVSMVDDIYQALFPELTQYTTLSGPMLVYQDIIRPANDESAVSIYFEFDFDQLYDYVVNFIDKIGTPSKKDPILKYLGFTTPSFRPGAIYKDEFVFNRRKLEFIKDCISIAPPASELLTGADRISAEQVEIIEEANSVGIDIPIVRDSNDICVENEVKNYFSTEGAIKSVITMTERELKENIGNIIEKTRTDIQREYAVEQSRVTQTEIIKEPDNFGDTAASSPDWLLGGQAFATARGSMGMRSEGQNDVGTVTPMQAMWPREQPPLAQGYNPEEIAGSYSDFKTKIGKVVKIFKKAQKELEEFEQGNDRKIIVPKIDLKKEAKKLEDFLGMLGNSLDFWQNPSNPQLNNLSSDDLYFRIKTRSSLTKRGFLEFRTIECHTSSKKKSPSVGMQGPSQAKKYRSEKMFDPSYTVGYLAALDQIIRYYNVNDMALGGCFSFMKPVRAVGLVQTFTVPRPHFAPNELSEEWPPFTGPIKTASEQAKDQFTNYLLSFQKGFDEWADEYQAKVDARDPIPNFSDEFNKVCNLEKLYAKVLDKLNIGSLICQVLKCMGLWPVAIDLNLSLVLPKIPKMPTFDPLGYLGKIIYKAIIRVLAQTLCKLVQTILDLLKLDCRGPDINLADRPDYGNAGPENIPLGARQLAQAATDVGLPEPLFDDSKDFVGDLSALLSPSELCSLYSGNASATVLQLASNLINRKFTSDNGPSLSAYLSDPDDMKVFFAKLGVLGASEVCDTIQQTLEQLPPEFDKPDDCACIDGEQLRDKLLRDKYAEEAGVTSSALKDALDRAKRNKELAKKAFEDLAAGKMLEKVIPELADFSNPASPLFDIPASFKGVIKTAVEGTLEAVKSQYYNDIRLYVPYLYSENIKVDSDSQTAPGANKMQEARKISTVETLRNYNFWLSIIRPDDFDPSQISTRNINQLYALYCLLYPVYKERYVAKVPGSEVFYLNEHISEEKHIRDAIADLNRVNGLDGINTKLETMEKVIELYPSPYSEPSNSQDYVFAVKQPEYINYPKNYITNSIIARSYNGAINPRSALKSVKLLNKMRDDLKGNLQTPQGRDWNIRQSQGIIQMYAFVGNDGEWLQLEPDQNYFRAPIIIGCSPPDLTAMHDGDEIDGEDIPFGFTKTFNIDSYTKDKLDRSSFLKTEILKKISERVQSLMSELTDLFAQSQSSGFTSGASGATKVVNEFLPKVKPLFNKEAELLRERGISIFNLEERSRDSEVVDYYGSSGIKLKSPAKLSTLAELMLSRIEGDPQYDEMVQNIKNQSEGEMRFTFGSADGSGNDENLRQINTTFSIIQDPHFTRLLSQNESNPIVLQSCKIIPPSLISDNDLNSIYSPGLGYTRSIDKPNALNLYTGMIISGSQQMFEKHNLNLTVNDDTDGPFAWIENSYSVSLESYFEDVFDQIFDSPFISSESYIESIRKKLTGTPFVKDEIDDSGCSLEQKGYEPVKILIDFEREVEAALSRVVKRMRTPGSFRNIDFKNPSPFEQGIRDTVILLFMKVLMYEFALRAGPAMSAFKATDILNHDYIPQFIADWILSHEIYNLKFFKKNPGFREVFEKSLIDTTGKSTSRDALLEILSQELPDVATRVDKLFDSYIEDSPSSFLQRMPYGSVFSVASVRPSRTPGNRRISSGRKFINLSYTESGSIERDLVNYEALGFESESDAGTGTLSSPAFDYAIKGGYILESFVKIKGPMAIEYQKFFLKFETVQEELRAVYIEAGDDLSQQSSAYVDFGRLEDDQEDLKDEIIVSLSEFRDYLQGDIIKPLLDNLGIDLAELGYSEECGLRPKFTEGYPSIPVKIIRNHTVIDSRHIDWLTATPGLFPANNASVPKDRTIDASSFDYIWNKYIGTVVPWHHNADHYESEEIQEAIREQSSAYRRHYILPKNLCPYLNTNEKEDDLSGALLDSDDIIANGATQAGVPSRQTFNDLVESNTTSFKNYNFDFNFLSRKIVDTQAKSEESTEKYRFTEKNTIDTSKLDIDVTNIDSSVYNISSKVGFYPTGSSSFPTRPLNEELNELTYEQAKIELEDMNMPRSYSNDEFDKILKPVLENMNKNHRASIVFDELVTPTQEQYEQLHESLSYSEKFGGIYQSPDQLDEEQATIGNYFFEEDEWQEVLGEKYGNNYQVWNQHVIDVVGFAAPMLDVGETFHSSEDLPVIDSHLKKVIKTADGFQFWKKYLSSPNHFFNHAASAGAVAVDNDVGSMGSHLVENQKFKGGYTRYTTDRHHPEYVLANELNPDNIIKRIFSNAEMTSKFYEGLQYSGDNQLIRPLATPYFGPDHGHLQTQESMAQYNQFLQLPSNEQYDMFTSPANHRMSLSIFPTLENVSSGMLDTSEEQSGIIERNYIFNKRSQVSTRCNADTPDEQACFFMSTFDKKTDGTMKMSRPLGVTPTFFSAGDSYSTPMADQSWTELRAYSPDIHIDFKWTYGEVDLGLDHYSFSDDHLFNSCIKTIYPSESDLIGQRLRLHENLSLREKQEYLDSGDGIYPDITEDAFNGKSSSFKTRYEQYYNVEDFQYRMYDFGASSWKAPKRAFELSGIDSTITPYGKQKTQLSEDVFSYWPKNIWQSKDYSHKVNNPSVSSVINMEGSFHNYNLAKRFSSADSVRTAIQNETNKSITCRPYIEGITGEKNGDKYQNKPYPLWTIPEQKFGYYGDALMQVQKVCDWSLHNVYNFSPIGWKMHDVAKFTSAKYDRGSFATGFKDEESWFSGRITNGDVGKYIKIPYNLGRINYNPGPGKGDIYSGTNNQNNYGYRSSFGFYNMAYNQVLYPLPFESSVYANVTKLFQHNKETRDVGVKTGDDYNGSWHTPKERFFKIPYRRITPATFGVPVSRTIFDKGHPLYEGIDYSTAENNAHDLNPAYRFKQWTERWDTEIRKELRKSAPGSYYEDTSDAPRNKAREMIKQKYSTVWELQNFYATKKLPPLTFFQKNLRKNHHHSPNQVRTPLRLFLTRVDFYHNGEAQQDKTKVLFSYDIPHALKGAETEFDSRTNKLKPVPSNYRKELLQRGLELACYEYLDYAKLERFAMRAPMNGTNIIKMLDKETSNALSMTWYTPHPIFMNEPRSSFYNESNRSVQSQYPYRSSDAIPFDALKNSQNYSKNGPTLGRPKTRTWYTKLDDDSNPHHPLQKVWDKEANKVGWNKKGWVGCDPPSANLGVVTVPYQARTYNNESAQVDGEKVYMDGFYTAVKGDASDDWDGPKVTITERRRKWGTGLYFMDRVSKALHGELIDYDYNPAISEGIGLDPRKSLKKDVASYENSPRKYQWKNKEADDLFDAIFFSTCGIPHGGPYVFDTSCSTLGDYVDSSQIEDFDQPRDQDYINYFNPLGVLRFTKDLSYSDGEYVNKEFEKSLKTRFSNRWMTSAREDGGNYAFKKFTYKLTNGEYAFNGHYPHLKQDLGDLTVANRDKPFADNYALHSHTKAFQIYSARKKGNRNRDMARGQIKNDENDYGTTFSFGKKPFQYYGSKTERRSIKDYTYAPLAGSYFYNPLMGLVSDSNMAHKNADVYKKNNLTNYNRQNWGRHMVDPFMSFSGHTNLMQTEYVISQIRRSAFTENGVAGSWSEDAFKQQFVSSARMSKGFVTVSKVYSLAAHQEVYDGYTNKENSTNNRRLSIENKNKNSFMTDPDFVDQQFFSLQSIELTSVDAGTDQALGLNAIGRVPQSIPNMTNFGVDASHVQYTNGTPYQFYRVNGVSDYVFPATDRSIERIKKRVHENIPTILGRDHWLGNNKINAVEVVTPHIFHESLRDSDLPAHQDLLHTHAMKLRQLISGVIKNYVAVKNEFGAWARMSCNAWLSGEVPEEKYLQNSEFFMQQSELSYSPVQALPNRPSFSSQSRIYRWRDIYDPSPSGLDLSGEHHKLSVRLGNYMVVNGTDEATKPLKIDRPSLTDNFTNKSLLANSLKIAENILSDESTQLPLAVREKISELKNEMNVSNSDLLERFEKSIYGKSENGETTPATEIYSGLRLVKLLDSGTSRRWFASQQQAGNFELIEKAHLTDRSFYVDIRDKTLKEDKNNVLVHLPIYEALSPICLPGGPDSSDNLEQWLQDQLNMDSSIIKQCIVDNHEKIKNAAVLKLISEYIYPSNDAKAAAAIYSSMTLTSQDKMHKLLTPTKNAFLNIVNSMGNKVQDPVSGIWQAPPPVSNAEYEVFLKNVGTGGPRVPCGGMPGFDAEEFFERILDLIIQLPASILTTLAMLLDPGYRVMHQRFTSCSPSDQHIKSLDWGAVATATEYGWGVEVDKLSQGTLGGNVPKGGKYANVLYSFPVDLFAGINFLFGPPFIMFNPSFGMAFVKLANYILGSVGVGSGAGGGLNTPCFGADMDASASTELLDGKNGYGHPLLVFGPLALTVNSWPFLRLPADDPSEQAKMCKTLEPPVGAQNGSNVDMNNRINSGCDPE
tara:strand:- start:11581 stop:25668 length:14088 start_codon:yes stop_codon:yes gene_type:complete